MTEQFIQERRYLLGVSPRAIIWYQCSFKAFEGAMTGKEAVRRRIVDLRQRNFSTITRVEYPPRRADAHPGVTHAPT
jgi:hypothetical protein